MGNMGLATPLMLLGAASLVSADAVPGGDLLSRYQALLEASPSVALPSSVSVAESALPTAVAAALASNSLAWSKLSDAMRMGVLWTYGYVPSAAGALTAIYTACDDGADPENTVGRFMDELAVARKDFNATGCAANTCGNFQQATNTNCSAAIAQELLCAVDDANGTAVFSTATGSFWSDAGTDSTAVPFPALYAHAISTVSASASNATSSSLRLLSVHMAADAPIGCGSTGDAIVPCLPLSQVGDQSFCRPKVDTARITSFYKLIKSQLAAATTDKPAAVAAAGGGGLSTGAIAGIAGGALVVLALLAFYFFRSRKNRSRPPHDRAEPDYTCFGRKSSLGGHGNSHAPGFATGATAATNTNSDASTSKYQRQGTSGNYPVIDSTRENDTVFSTDYVDESSRQRPFAPPRNLLSSMESVGSRRSRGSSVSGVGSFRGGMFGKSIEEYCDESEIVRDFLGDAQINLRRIQFDELTVLRILSKGSYGEVYLGQLETRHVAMKRLLPEKKHLTKSIEQFMGEIQLMCSLEHRNIVTFVGVSWDYLQNLCAVVEYMDNGDLSEVLAKSKTKFSWPKEKISIAMDVAEGLVYLHSMRPVVVHRDLKSKNVLLNKRGQAKLSDFGVSRKTAVNETMTSGVGTLLWTAPEIIEGRKYSEKADIFSLGVVLSEIDTCEEPYSTVTNDETGERLPGMQIVQMVRLGELTVNFRDDCPPKLRELVLQCTSLDPDQRPTSMEVAYTLKSIIAPSLRAAA